MAESCNSIVRRDTEGIEHHYFFNQAGQNDLDMDIKQANLDTGSIFQQY
uniref:Uncharacterized protein n=1 Tax=Rhizophora mucronata TaxID=61149 RepID=A0A2P2PGB4_RHIMU